jgi:hypothetical protein
MSLTDKTSLLTLPLQSLHHYVLLRDCEGSAVRLTVGGGGNWTLKSQSCSCYRDGFPRENVLTIMAATALLDELRQVQVLLETVWS